MGMLNQNLQPISKIETFMCVQIVKQFCYLMDISTKNRWMGILSTAQLCILISYTQIYEMYNCETILIKNTTFYSKQNI